MWPTTATLLFVAVFSWTGCGPGTIPQVGPEPDRAALIVSAPQRIDEADSVLREAVGQELVPGAVLIVTENGKTLHRDAYGFASLYDYDGRRLDNPERMSVNHVFDLASLTKVFATTFGIMMLVDRGDVNLDDPLSVHLAGFAGPSKDSIRVRDLLTHGAGLFQWKPIYYHARNRHESFDYIRALPLAYPVGRARHYSDLGFMLLGYLIEDKTGSSIDDFLHRELYEPLGLVHTMYVPRSHGLTGPFAATSHGNPFEKRMVYDDNFGYKVDEDPDSFTGWRHYTLVGEVNDGNAFYAHQGVAGHAGLFSTADELTQLLQFLLENGVHDGERMISETVIETFLTKGAFGNGLGWAMSPEILGMDDPPEGAFGHTGFTGTYAVALPSERTTIVLLTNRQNLGVGPDGRYHSLGELQSKVAAAVLRAVRQRDN